MAHNVTIRSFRFCGDCIVHLSSFIYLIERWALTFIIAGIFGFISLNVFANALSAPIYWVDELVSNLMVISALVGASMLLRSNDHPSVALLENIVSENTKNVLGTVVNLVSLGFSVSLIVLSWIWFDPVGVWNSGFNLSEYTVSSDNFLYQEPTNTLGINRFWFWLSIPLIGIFMLIHNTSKLFTSQHQAQGLGE